MRVVWFYLSLLVFCVSCGPSRSTDEGNVLHADLEKTVNPMEQIFSKAEVIPLETMDSSLIVWMKSVFPVGEKLYIHDDWAAKLHVFDQTGKYERKISRRGQGQGEYLNMFDCYVDVPRDEIYMLGVYGHIKKYSLEGIFKESIELPARPHYYSVVPLDDKYMATWSCLEKEEGSVLVMDKHAADTLGSYWHDDRMFNNQQYAPFFQYGEKTFFAVSLRQQVYELTTSGLHLAYEWDFGKYNIRESTLEYYLNIENHIERNKKIISDYGSEMLPFILSKQRQNTKYCYVGLQRKSGMRPPMTHVFYDKERGESVVFDYLDGKACRLNAPLYFGEDYILTDLLYENREDFRSVLPASEYQKLEAMLEDDNPCLLKLYFKK